MEESVAENYRGRFAPSPTGPLHFGSLVTAVASYLDAKSHQGAWLVRMEDVDTPRVSSGYAHAILTTLESYGFEWDESVIYQSRRSDLYHSYISQLEEQSLIYACACSRKSIKAYLEQNHYPYPGYPAICRHLDLPKTDLAKRINTCGFEPVEFHDRIQGVMTQNVQHVVGDFVLQRKDGIFSYQLAVVVDDAHQNITHVVRGFDLFDNTPRQLLLQKIFHFPQPCYAHIPIATNQQGDKLSKQSFAPSVEGDVTANILKALAFLGQEVEPSMIDLSNNELWEHAIKHWDMRRIPSLQTIAVE